MNRARRVVRATTKGDNVPLSDGALWWRLLKKSTNSHCLCALAFLRNDVSCCSGTTTVSNATKVRTCVRNVGFYRSTKCHAERRTSSPSRTRAWFSPCSRGPELQIFPTFRVFFEGLTNYYSEIMSGVGFYVEKSLSSSSCHSGAASRRCSVEKRELTY